MLNDWQHIENRTTITKKIAFVKYCSRFTLTATEEEKKNDEDRYH
jgi:hypothetical protein